MPDKLDALRRCQHWELLRIGACDAFGLLDLKSVTVQLSLLTDSIVQACLTLLADDLELSLDGFVVLAFGKLGGEELNYSSDIDLVFLADSDATRYWPLGQKLIKALTEATGEGFLYRVDMRLRPWGKSGALVNTVDSHLQYLQKHGRQWEKQALLKARPIAGNLAVGREFLRRVRPLMFGTPIEELRESVRGMKDRIEAELKKQGRKWGEVKAGTGSIRDVEFTTQFLQLAHGGQHPEVLSFNTLDGLVRLADFGFIQADEYRQLTSGYVFLRTVEHALQLMHHKQTHTLPESGANWPIWPAGWIIPMRKSFCCTTNAIAPRSAEFTSATSAEWTARPESELRAPVRSIAQPFGTHGTFVCRNVSPKRKSPSTRKCSSGFRRTISSKSTPSL